MEIKCPNPDCGEDHLFTTGEDNTGLYAISHWPKADSAIKAHWNWRCETCKRSFTLLYDLVITKIEAGQASQNTSKS